MHQVKSEAPKLEDLYAVPEAAAAEEELKPSLSHSRSLLGRSSSGKERAEAAKKEEAERDAAMRLKVRPQCPSVGAEGEG